MNLNTPFDRYRKKRPLRPPSILTPAGSASNSFSETIEGPITSPSGATASKYKVLYRKYSTKKNKTWEGDGILYYNCKTNTAFVKNENGFKIATIKNANEVIFRPIFTSCGHDFEIDDDEISTAPPKMILTSKNTPAPTKPAKPSLSRVDTTTNGVFSAYKPPTIMNKSFTATAKTVTKPLQKLNSNVENSSVKTLLHATGQPPLKRKKVNSDTGPIYDVSNLSDPLYMPDPTPSFDQSEKIKKVVVDPSISIKLRQHQREGITFLYSCLLGFKGDTISGAILADEMGLGKTLQTISLIWTLLKQSPLVGSKPVIEKVLICCPVSLVNNWKNEFHKWLGMNRLNVLTINNSKFSDERQDIELFGRNKVYDVMIIGYEKMQAMSDILSEVRFDLLVCDEGHRLKNSENKTMKTLESFNIRRKIVLTGTPIQNDLVEFFTVVNFTNPGILGDLKSFQKTFIKPILDARNPDCNNKNVIEEGKEKAKQLLAMTNKFILRRSNTELEKYLPKRSDYIIMVPPTSLQLQLFKTIIETKKFRNFIETEGKGPNSKSNSEASSFNLINTFRKICNSPSLLKDDGFFLELCERNTSSLEDSTFRNQLSKKIKSGKMLALIKILSSLHATEEKVVIVSNFTATLDIIESLFKSLNLSFLRLDGSTQSNERSKIVDKFNKTKSDSAFALLLSAKAGGVGLNLIGASRLILYDNDWNPAIDLQAIARIHRDGQKKEVKIYRLLTAGCIDEKIFQRQLVKQDLSDRFVDQKGGEKELFDRNDLKDIFSIPFDKLERKNYSNTHEMMECDCKGDPSSEMHDTLTSPSDEDTQEYESDAKEMINFMTAYNFSQKYPTNETENDRKIAIAKKKKLKRCMKGYKHVNPFYSTTVLPFPESNDEILNTILKNQNKEAPLISYIFGKF